LAHAQCQVWQESIDQFKRNQSLDARNRVHLVIFLLAHLKRKQHGVWTIENGEAKLLKLDYFHRHPQTQKPVHFNEDYYLPFIRKYFKAISQEFPASLLLFEPIPNSDPPRFTDDDRKLFKNMVYAPHWYDLKTLFNKVILRFSNG
jgi:hypothetical protein